MNKFDEIKRKSLENGKAADILIASHLYAASIHCSYYMVLQYAMNFVFQKKGKTIEELINQAQITDGQKKPGHHVVTRNELMSILRALPDRHLFREFRDTFNTLYQLRVKADYTDNYCGEEDAITSRRKSSELKKKLDTLC